MIVCTIDVIYFVKGRILEHILRRKNIIVINDLSHHTFYLNCFNAFYWLLDL